MVKILFGGKFKPPHNGHLSAAQWVASSGDEIHIIISNKPVEDITPEISKNIWSLYISKLENKGIYNIQITELYSPVKQVYEMVKDQNHEFIVLYGKEDRERYDTIEKFPKTYPNVKIMDVGNFDGFCSTDLRKYIHENNLKKIEQYLPEDISIEEYMSIINNKNEI